MKFGIGKVYKLLDTLHRDLRLATGIIELHRLQNDLAVFYRQIFNCPLRGPWLRDNRAISERTQNPANGQNRIGTIHGNVSPLMLGANLLSQRGKLAFQCLEKHFPLILGRKGLRPRAEENLATVQKIPPDNRVPSDSFYE